MQYALIFSDLQLILAQMGGEPAHPTLQPGKDRADYYQSD
jgi:hypothetical protein